MKVEDLKEGYLYKDYSKRGHCKNGTFNVKIKNNKTYIIDTYWNSGEYIEATDDFVENFEEVLKLDEWEITSNWDRVKLYSEKDWIQIHYTQCSGRISGKFDYFIRKSAIKNKYNVIDELESKISWQKSKLDENMKQLKALKNGEIGVNDVYIR